MYYISYSVDINVCDITDIPYADRLRTGELEGMSGTCQTSTRHKSRLRRGWRQYAGRDRGEVIK